MMKLRLLHLGDVMRMQDSLEKPIMLEKVEGSRKRRPNMRWIDSLKEAIELSLEEPSKAVEDRTFCRSLIHGVAISWG